jgi:uncharacterized iron-regulated protein
MKKINISFILIMILSNIVMAQDKPAYILYNNKGKEVKYHKMVKDLAEADMIFFGEYHTNPISHWLQFELAKSLHKIKGDQLYFGAEMFENGNQLVINEYLAGFYPEKKMLVEITQLWKNYQTDYKPLVEFAKENKLRFIATNIPRRYASMIYKHGMGTFSMLSPEAKAMIGPLEKYYDASVYEDMKANMGGHIPPTMDNIQLSQASKDATMAKFSVESFNEGNLLLHLDGSYHSNNHRGIVWWVNKIKPGLNIKTITTLTMSEWEAMTKEEKKSIANYIIVVADNMTQTNG